MMRAIRINSLKWYTRLPLKRLLFALVTTVVCYPYPGLLMKHFAHWRNPNKLVDPSSPALAPLAEELRASLPPSLTAQQTLKHVEEFVYKHIPYDWDWNTWGMADYMPTVEEVLEKGREDCDGRAVVAASLLAGLGFQAEIVTDFVHVWVKTERGETMGPGRKKAIVATRKGLQFNWRGLTELPRALAYGVAVFPATRELILVFVLWLLMLGPRSGVRASALGLALLVGGLFSLRFGGTDHLKPVLWMQWIGILSLTGGCVIMLIFLSKTKTGTVIVENDSSNCDSL